MQSEPFQRFRIDLAYDGRPYAGWQSQPNGLTVQDELLASLQKICPSILTVQGSGRTDAGVSAQGQVAHFDVRSDWKMDSGEWLRALNANLPPTIRIFSCERVGPDFHSRFSAVGKCYLYTLATCPVLPPLQHGLVWHFPQLGSTGELDRMNQFLHEFVGTHDFRSFSAQRNDGKDESRDTVRCISKSEVRSASESGFWHLEFCGNGFLYKMVRFLVGTAIYHQLGKISRERVGELLSGEFPSEKAPYCAPASGLSLQSVSYPL